MNLKRQISFKLRPYGKNNTVYQIQMHVTFNGQRMRFSTGCQVNSLADWDAENELVVPGYRGKKGETDVTINGTLRKNRDEIDTVFKYFEVNEISPSVTQVIDKYNEKVRGLKPQKPEPEKKAPKETSFWTVFDRFDHECGEKNAWTVATHKKMDALKADLSGFKKDLRFKDLDEAGLTAFVIYLRDKKHLRTPRKKKGVREEYDKEDITGLRNSTIKKKLEFLSWFLNWATDHGYNTNLAYRSFRPTLKETQKRVIYLTKPELEKIKQLEIPAEHSNLEAVRDVFMFCCFSGLRHSDAYNLRRNDIKDDRIEVTTVKTSDNIIIELNTVTRAILDKYKDVAFAGNKALPVIQNQPMNRDLKSLCKLAGINEKIRITTYKGNERTDEIKEKWELVGTHTGRRTFIVNCLSLGIAPNVVMKWTGHSSYSAMRPYIDIVDAVKANEMTKLDNLL
jgi:integrase